MSELDKFLLFIAAPAVVVFSFWKMMPSLALVAGNALAVVRQAISTIHGQAELDQLSGYYLADELAKICRQELKAEVITERLT